jgi:uncharacterized cupin superfamily protein
VRYVIYIISGSGKVMVDGNVETVNAGSAVLFPQGKVHMLSNTGAEEMKVVCFFAPPSELKTYKFDAVSNFRSCDQFSSFTAARTRGSRRPHSRDWLPQSRCTV